MTYGKLAIAFPTLGCYKIRFADSVATKVRSTGNLWQVPQLDTELPNQKDAPSQGCRGKLQVYRGNEWGPARL